MQFKDIIGQEQIKSQLIRTFNENRLSHALMLVGPKGVGKLSLTIAYAQYISCLDKQPEDSCGICSSCKKYQKLVHPDLHFVFPVVKNKSNGNPVSDQFLTAWREQIVNDSYIDITDWYRIIGVDNAQGLIYSQESNEIIRKLSLKSYESDYKTMIVWLPEKMHRTTANKLLKMIEEPPDKTIFLMVSEEPDKILKTILSRTQILRIPRIEINYLKTVLEEKFNLKSDEAGSIARLAQGSYYQARILMQNSAEDQFNLDRFIRIMRLCYAQKIPEIMVEVEEMASIGREKQKNFLLYALRMIRENFILTLQQTEMVYLNNTEIEFSQKFSPFINEKNICALSDELSKAYADMERNANAKIVFLDMTLRFVKLLRA